MDGRAGLLDPSHDSGSESQGGALGARGSDPRDSAAERATTEGGDALREVAMKSFVALSILMMMCAPSASAQTDEAKSTPAPAIPTTSAQHDAPTGQLRVSGNVRIGETAPDFTAYSTADREVTLSRMRGDWVVLLFAESREAFGALRAVYDPVAGCGARTVGICKDKIQRLRSYADGQQLPFELLSDDTGEISSIYGYYDLQQRATTPGFVVMDRRGVVRLALQGDVQPQSIVDLVRFTILGEKATAARTP